MKTSEDPNSSQRIFTLVVLLILGLILCLLAALLLAVLAQSKDERVSLRLDDYQISERIVVAAPPDFTTASYDELFKFRSSGRGYPRFSSPTDSIG